MTRPAEADAPLDCAADWARCAGLVDWTTFVDFSNLALAGAELGWRTRVWGACGAGAEKIQGSNG